MANRFWVTGGTGNWNSTTNWSTTTGGASGASVPGVADIALLDASSGAGTVTLNISPDILSMNNTGFTGTLAFGTNTISVNSTGTVFTGSTAMTVTGTPQIILTNNSATARTITPTAVTEANSISFRITAGTGTLSINTGAVRNLDFTDGTNPTGYAGAAQNMVPTIYGNFKASTGMTKVAGTGTFTFAATSGTKTINTAGVTFDNPFTFNGVGGTWQLQAALTSGASRTTTLTNGTLDLSGFTLTIGFFSSSNSNTRTLAFGIGQIALAGSGATIVSMATVTNFTYTGTPTVNCTYSGSVGTRTLSFGTTAGGIETNSIDINVNAGTDTIAFSSGNVCRNLNFTGFTGSLASVAARTIYGSYTNPASVVGTISGTVATVFASTSATPRTITSNAITLDFPVTFNGVGGTWVTQDAMVVETTRTTTLTNGTLDFNNLTLSTGIFSSSGTNVRAIAFGTGNLTLTGNSATILVMTIATGFTYTGTPTVNATYSGSVGTRSYTFGTTGTPLESQIISLNVAAASDAFTFVNGTRVNSLSFNNSYTGLATLGTGVFFAFGNLTLSTGMTIASGNITFSSTSVTPRTITTAGKTMDFPLTFNGVGGTWELQDAVTLGSTRNMTMTNGTVKLKAGTTNTVGAIATSGTNQKYLQSTISGTRATLTDASGTSSVSYLTIQDSAATGGAVFQAYLVNNNVNAGNNTGWLFAPIVGNFFMVLI